MYCINCGKKSDENKKFCVGCGTQLIDAKNKEPQLQKTKSFRLKKGSMGNIVAVIMILFVIGVISNITDYINNEGEGEEVTKIYEDAIRGTDTASTDSIEYVNIVKKYLVYIKSENSKMFSVCASFDEDEFLEFSSFEPQSKLKLYIADIEACTRELEDFETKYNQYKRDSIKYLNDLANNSNISTEEKKALSNSANESMNDEKLKQLSIKRLRTLNNHMNVVLDIYELLDNNYYDYELAVDEYGDDTIDIYVDDTFVAYNELAEKSEITSAAYLKAENDLFYYLNNEMQNEGVNLDVNEIVDYMYE